MAQLLPCRPPPAPRWAPQLPPPPQPRALLLRGRCLTRRGAAAAASAAAGRTPDRGQPEPPAEAMCRPIEVSRSMAAARAAETRRPDALVGDPYAQLLCGEWQHGDSAGGGGGSQAPQQQQQQHLLDVLATRYIDESLLNAVAATNINSIRSGDFRQVVLLGDGFDCRPFRLPWPPGTTLFLVAPAEVHEQAEALLAEAELAGVEPARTIRGCLLRRVNMNLGAATAAAAAAAAADDGGGSSGVGREHTAFSSELLRAGFRADRLSVWAVQGLHGQGVGPGVLQQLLAEVANCAAFHSVLVGELPGPLSRREAENLLAEAGLLGAVYAYEDQEGYSTRRQQGEHQGEQQQQQQGGAGASGAADRWLCTAQQLRLSLEQMGVYEDWSAEYGESEVGDDFIGNFS